MSSAVLQNSMYGIASIECTRQCDGKHVLTPGYLQMEAVAQVLATAYLLNVKRYACAIA